MTMSTIIGRLLIKSYKRISTPITCACRNSNHQNILLKSNSRFFSSDKPNPGDEITEINKANKNQDVRGSISQKFKIFRDEDAQTVFDVSEEMERIQLKELEEEEASYRDPFEGLNLTRGKTGVFDIEDLIQCLQKDKAQNIYVVKVPDDWAYVSYIVIVTAKSVRHMKALMEFIRKVYKAKRYDSDRIPIAEGKNSLEWQAIDLGNIALHIFIHETRQRFDLETLWAVGSKYDDLTTMPKESETMMSYGTYDSFLDDYQPVETEPEEIEEVQEQNK